MNDKKKNQRIFEYFAPNTKVDITNNEQRIKRNNQIMSAFAPLEVMTDIKVNWLYNSILLCPLPDLHAGNINARMDLFDKWLRVVYSTYNSAVILNGDIFDNATQNSISNTHDENLAPEEVIDYLYRKFHPIAKQGKIVAITPGNHDSKDSKRGVDANVSILKILASKLDVPFAEHNAKITFNMPIQNFNKRANFVVGAMHGAGKGGSTAKSLDVMCEQVQSVFAGHHIDLAVTGHTHPPKGAVTSIRYEEPEKDKYNRTICSTRKEMSVVICPTLQDNTDYATAANLQSASPNAFMLHIKMLPNPYYKINEHENDEYTPHIVTMGMFKNDGTLTMPVKTLVNHYFIDSVKIAEKTEEKIANSTIGEIIRRTNLNRGK